MNSADWLTALGQRLADHRNLAGWPEVIHRAGLLNPWFTPEAISLALDNWSLALRKDAVNRWLEQARPVSQPKNVGLIAAGNIPLAGLHDLLSILVSNHNVILKPSSDDEELMKAVLNEIRGIVPDVAERVTIAEKLNSAEAAIATGSNNSSRYFEYYFRNIPYIIRKNRNSLAVLSGNETEEELEQLGHDVFDYFGLGCRNITHLLLPQGFDMGKLFRSWQRFGGLIDHHRYANNYTYHKAILLMNLTPHLDAGFVLMQEKNELYSPVSCLNYSYYSDASEAEQYIREHQEQIQCITGNGYLPFGSTQKPELWDYADGINTLEFLGNI